MKTSFYTKEELTTIGFKSVGDNVLISRKASLYGVENIVIGNNVRIDDFCVISISKSLIIGNYVHIACNVSIIGCGEIILSDYCGLSGRVSLYSSSDDYSGEYMTNPMVPKNLTNVISKMVYIGRHVIVGCGSVILPGVKIDDGVAIGAMTLVQRNCKKGYIYSGNPMKIIAQRSSRYLELEKKIKNY